MSPLRSATAVHIASPDWHGAGVLLHLRRSQAPANPLTNLRAAATVRAIDEFPTNSARVGGGRTPRVRRRHGGRADAGGAGLVGGHVSRGDAEQRGGHGAGQHGAEQ